MSEQTTAAATPAATDEVVLLPAEGDAAFAALMGALAPDADTPPAGEGGAAAPAAAGGDGQPATQGQGTAAAAGEPGTPAAGGAAVPGVAPGGAAGAAGTARAEAGADDGRPPVDPTWTADSSTLAPKWAEITTAVEESAVEEFREVAFDEVKEEYGKYFEALEVHPRQLVGQTVPRIGAEGEETLRDSKDAEEWQAAVKQILTQEIQDRATRLLDDAEPALQSVHASIELFQKNPDLVPFTKQFDKELADRFATFLKPYEIRVDGALRGYQIPTQPLIEQLRAQLVAERSTRRTTATASTAPASTPGAAPAAGRPAQPTDRPQAGIPSKAGSGEGQEDFSALFGTIGLPQLRI